MYQGVALSKMDFISMDTEHTDLQSIQDANVELEVVLLKQKIPLKDLMALKQNSTLILDTPITTPAYLSLNGKAFARGTIVQANEFYGIEITEIQT